MYDLEEARKQGMLVQRESEEPSHSGVAEALCETVCDKMDHGEISIVNSFMEQLGHWSEEKVLCMKISRGKPISLNVSIYHIIID